VQHSPARELGNGLFRNWGKELTFAYTLIIIYRYATYASETI
jgi:hypothetical protein